MKWALKSALFLLGLTSSGCQPDRPAATHEKVVNMGMGTVLTERNPITGFVDELSADLSDGDLMLRTYPGGSLGTEIEREEQLMLGLLPFNISSGTHLMQFSPELSVLKLPFFIDSADTLHCLIADTDFLDAVNRRTEPLGIHVAGVVFSGSMAGLFTTDSAITDPADLNGRRIRAMDRVQVETLGALGASPTKLPWEEIQTALQTGIANGYINPPSVAIDFRHERQVRHFIDLRIFAGFRFVTISQRWRDGLDKTERELLDAALDRALDGNLQTIKTKTEQDLQDLDAAGISVTIPDEATSQKLRKAARQVWPRLASDESVSAVSWTVSAHCPGAERP